jgi:hypothetical protein
MIHRFYSLINNYPSPAIRQGLLAIVFGRRAGGGSFDETILQPIRLDLALGGDSNPVEDGNLADRPT